MQWLIDIVKEWIQAQGYLTHSFVDRGDPGPQDFETENFTTDGAWHDLDLSDIIPAGTKAVALRIGIMDNEIGSYIQLRTKGNTFTTNSSGFETQIADIAIAGDFIQHPDSSRLLQYRTINRVFTLIQITVKGWWL